VVELCVEVGCAVLDGVVLDPVVLDRAVLDGAADRDGDVLAEEAPHEVRINSSANIPTRVFTSRGYLWRGGTPRPVARWHPGTVDSAAAAFEAVWGR
jgi:hypothetical protein